MQAMFVSSTFKDMQGERDALHRLVMPSLREKAKEYAQGVQFVDLRWGISTADCDSEDGAGKILEVCLDEIRQCKPYMIVLLGQRYGWMPSPALLESTASEKDFALDNFEMSVTELEIRYGMYMAAGQLDRCIFCLRDDIPEEILPEHLRQVYLADSQEDRKRMENLRRRICDTPGAHVLRYHLDWDAQKQELTGYDRFAESLGEKLQAILLPAWQQYRNLSWQQKQREEDRLLITMHQDSFVGREREQEELMGQIDTHRVVILEGEGGCGKSALMAQLLKRYRQRGIQAELFCCGNSSRCMSAGQLTELLLWQMCQFSGQEMPAIISSAQTKKEYDKLMETYRGPRVVLFIDAIDQLTPDAELYRSVFVPGKMSEDITLVITTTGAVRVEPTALPTGKRGSASLVCKLTPPDKEELRQILHARFRAEHKQISAELADKLLANPTSQNMLGMELMVRQLVMLDKDDFAKIAALEQTMDSDRAINTYLMEVADGFSTNLERRINEYIDAVCRFVDPDETAIIVIYIYLVALLQNGMSMSKMEAFSEYIGSSRAFDQENLQIQRLRSWNQMRFARLSRYMGNLLIRRGDGRIDFSHRLLREAMGNRSSVDNLAAALIGWFLERPGETEDALENMLVLLRRYYASRKQGDENYRWEPEILDIMTTRIREAGVLLESKDPGEKREGYRQMEILQRSILWDLSGSRRKEHLDHYCELLDAVIAAGGTSNHFTVWFFGVRIVGELMGRSEQDRAMGLQILCRLLVSLQKRWEEDAAQGKTWTDSQNRRLLQYYIQALKILGQLRFSNSLGLVEFGSSYGWGQEKLVEQGVSLAEYAIRKMPESYQIYGSSALIHCYGVKVLLGIRVNMKKLIPRLDTAMVYAERMLEMSRSLPEQEQRRWTGNYVHILATCLDAMLDLEKTMVFPSKKLRARMETGFRTTWEVIRLGENRDRIPAEYLLEFALTWNRYKVTQFHRLSGNEKLIRPETTNVIGEIYYNLHKAKDRTFSRKERQLLAKLGAELGFHLLYGLVPDAMKADGYNTHTARRFVVEKEGGYLQAQAENGFDNRYTWTLMLVVEASVYDGKDHARAIATAKRGEAELVRLQREWKKGSCSMYDLVDLEKLQEYLQNLIRNNQKWLDERK